MGAIAHGIHGTAHRPLGTDRNHNRARRSSYNLGKLGFPADAFKIDNNDIDWGMSQKGDSMFFARKNMRRLSAGNMLRQSTTGFTSLCTISVDDTGVQKPIGSFGGSHWQATSKINTSGRKSFDTLSLCKQGKQTLFVFEVDCIMQLISFTQNASSNFLTR